MVKSDILARVSVDPQVCGGKPVIRGTRVLVAIVLDALAEGLTPEQVVDHYPNVSIEDVRATLAYAAVLAQENTWKFAI